MPENDLKPGFWRRELIDPALDEDAARKIAEQKAWIAADPANPRPYYHLAQLYRMQHRRDDALGLLLEAVRLEPAFAEAHAALTEMYAVADDYPAAWRHARAAESSGLPAAAALLERHRIPEPSR
ncbi:MAG: tetratricopeptide repeat protein [Bryobacteraceae bacterium]